jgi:hypothetical protein
MIDDKLKTKITKEITLLASQNGFKRNGRYFRRHFPDSISVLKTSFSTIPGSAGNETRLRFSLLMGVCYPFVPMMNGIPPIEDDGERLLPEDADCTFRLYFHNTIDQAPQRWESDFWDLSNESQWNQILPRFTFLFNNSALPWFERYSNLHEALHDLLNLEEDMRATCGMGRRGSIIRLWNAVFVALRLDELSIARQCIDQLCSLSYKPTFASENPILLELKEKLGAGESV